MGRGFAENFWPEKMEGVIEGRKWESKTMVDFNREVRTLNICDGETGADMTGGNRGEIWYGRVFHIFHRVRKRDWVLTPATGECEMKGAKGGGGGGGNKLPLGALQHRGGPGVVVNRPKGLR